MNYTELSAKIAEYAENYESTFLADIPTFVRQAEQRIYQAVQPPVLRQYTNIPLTIGSQFVTLPAGFLASYALAVVLPGGSYQFLINKDVNYIREAYPNPAETGVPAFYALYNSTSVIVGPTPDLAYNTELNFFAYPQSIVTAGNTWLGDNFDPALLYGSLLEAGVFSKFEEDIMTYYKTQFDTAMQALSDLADGKERRDAYRSGQKRIPVQKG